GFCFFVPLSFSNHYRIKFRLMKHFDVLKSSLMILLFTLGLSMVWGQNTEDAWINEFHYSDAGADANEFVEITIKNPENYDLTLLQVDLYNGNGGTSYDNKTLNNFTVGSTEGNYTFYSYTYPSNGIQNGDPDGIALSYNGTLIQFISYGGSFSGSNGVANGVNSTDIGIAETSSTTDGYSLYLTGTGSGYNDFTWEGPNTHTKGTLNTGQILETGSPTQTATPSITATGIANGIDTYWNTADVSIETFTPDATIYYTTDGNAPTTSSSVYSVPFTINSTTTVKAMATAAGLDDSNIATKEFTITTPATATVPYSEDFNNTLGDWFSYTNAGVNWLPTADGVSVNGDNSQSELVWLISPEFQSIANGMLLSFDHISNFTTGNDLEIRYSTNYAGFGDPTTATWTTASTVPSVDSGSVID